MNKRIFTWYLLLKKRLLRKTGFLIILLLIPLFAGSFAFAAKDGAKGMVRVGLGAQNQSDPIAKQMLNDMNSDSTIFQFEVYETENDVIEAVQYGHVDVGWVFCDDMQDRLEKISAGKKTSLVNIYEVEHSVLLELTKEKVFSVIFPYIAYELYEQYITEELLPGTIFEENELREKFEVVTYEEDFIDFVFLNSEETKVEELNVLVGTLRGILVALMLLAGIAAVIYFRKDEEQELFLWIPQKHHIWVCMANNFAAISLAGIAATIALICSGNYQNIALELVTMFLFVVMATIFCTILGTLCKKVGTVCALLPIILVLSVVFCPVFVWIRCPGQVILPPYLYLLSISDPNIIWNMLVYCGIGMVILVLLANMKKIRGES